MKKIHYKIFISLLAVVLFFGLIGFLETPMVTSHSISSDTFNYGLDFVGMITLALLYVTTFDLKNSYRSYRAYPFMLVFIFLALYSDALCWAFDGYPEGRVMSVVSNTIFYSCSIYVSYAYMRFVLDYMKIGTRLSAWAIRIATPLAALMQILYFLNYRGEFFFSVEPSGFYSHGPLFAICFVFPFLIMVPCLFFIYTSKNRTTIQKVALSLHPVLLFTAGVLQSFTTGISFMYPVSVFSVFFIYSALYVRRGAEILEDNTKIKEVEMKMNEQQELIMLSQIQPHFMFNSLSSIAHLTKKDGDMAYQLTMDFADYLRHNLDSLSSEALVPFSKELDHVKKYVSIEKYRFGKKLKVHYDIKVDEFMVPVLSIQPLVENAVRHGILQRKEGGTVTLSTWTTGNKIYLSVSDDGVGFDPEAIKNDGKVHVGLENVKFRFQSLCSATFTVQSKLWEGTTVLIEIPIL